MRKQASRFSIGGVPFPREYEVTHALLVGTTGSGKTVVLKTVLDAMERDNQRVVPWTAEPIWRRGISTPSAVM
jgi:Cdc6-like AAA superfamily ATPase